MIFVAAYLFSGLLLGLMLYVKALVVSNRGEKERGRKLMALVERHPVMYAVASAIIWPVYLKWIFLGN